MKMLFNIFLMILFCLSSYATESTGQETDVVKEAADLAGMAAMAGSQAQSSQIFYQVAAGVLFSKCSSKRYYYCILGALSLVQSSTDKKNKRNAYNACKQLSSDGVCSFTPIDDEIIDNDPDLKIPPPPKNVGIDEDGNIIDPNYHSIAKGEKNVKVPGKGDVPLAALTGNNLDSLSDYGFSEEEIEDLEKQKKEADSLKTSLSQKVKNKINSYRKNSPTAYASTQKAPSFDFEKIFKKTVIDKRKKKKNNSLADLNKDKGNKNTQSDFFFPNSIFEMIHNRYQAKSSQNIFIQ